MDKKNKQDIFLSKKSINIEKHGEMHREKVETLLLQFIFCKKKIKITCQKKAI